MRSLKLFAFLLSFWMLSCTPDICITHVDTVRGDVLKASYVGGSATRTEIGDTTSTHSYAQINWCSGDKISLLYSDSGSIKNASLITQQAGTSAVFFPESPTEFNASSYLGLYPYSESCTASFSPLVINAEIPVSQKGRPGNFDPAAQLAAGYTQSYSPGSLDMQFYNVCSGLCFSLKGKNYTRIEFKGNGGELIAGPVSISMSTPSSPVASPSDKASDTVSLLPADGASTFEANKDYYISFLPGYFQSGFTVKFYVGENAVSEACNASLTFRRGAFGWVKGIDEPGKLGRIRDGELLTVNDEPGNCYIVSTPGTYKFPLVMGNDASLEIPNADSAEVLWETVNTSSAPNEHSIVDNVAINHGLVYFDVPSPITDGNALIAVKDKAGVILWSWHIWVCNGYKPELEQQTLYGKKKPMMDRNLGALSNSPSSALSNGLFYQWGRKDPFPGSAERYVSLNTGGSFIALRGAQMERISNTVAGTTVDYAIKHPTQFFTSTDGHWLLNEIHTLWADTKTIYDPCPPGWKVPPAYVLDANYEHVHEDEAWYGVPFKSVMSSGEGYGTFFDLAGSSSGRAWYPKNGYVSFSGILYMVGQLSCYWSCSPNADKTFLLQLSQTMDGSPTVSYYQNGKVRGEGHSVRCIADI